jgi:hypothetical protein
MLEVAMHGDAMHSHSSMPYTNGCLEDSIGTHYMQVPAAEKRACTAKCDTREHHACGCGVPARDDASAQCMGASAA